MSHNCIPTWADNDKALHGDTGPAIYVCFENVSGEFWVHNGEYESRVNYCPYCGEKAPKQVEP